jgi:ubiquinone/menaquinone biosynthesis C-methylase UbiE
VLQYDQVMTTKLAIAYAVGLEVIYRYRPEPFGGSAIDLACGPGHFSLCMARYLQLDRLQGIDLSPRMVETASKNARAAGAAHVSFHVADITRRLDAADGSVGLCTFCDAAHHLPGLDAVGAVIKEMDRVTKPSGLVVVMDLARLKSAAVTETYVNLVGQDYKARGLSAFFNDFRNSMYAAWTTAELARTAPTTFARRWIQLAPAGLPTIQFLIGMPQGQPGQLRRGVPWPSGGAPLPAPLRNEWRMMRQTLLMSRFRKLAN